MNEKNCRYSHGGGNIPPVTWAEAARADPVAAERARRLAESLGYSYPRDGACAAKVSGRCIDD